MSANRRKRSRSATPEKPNYKKKVVEAKAKRKFHGRPGRKCLYSQEHLKIVSKWKGQVNLKVQRSAPFNFFLSRIHGLEETHDEDLTMSFWELLDPSLGTLEHTVFFTFMVDALWFAAEYGTCGDYPATTVFYGQSDVDVDIQHLPPNFSRRIMAHKINMPDQYSHHHTKLMLYFYKDGSMRIVVTTANLTANDWENRVQGLWVSLRLPKLPDNQPDTAGESVTNFKKDLLDYFRAYKLDAIKPWIKRLERIDMSSTLVCLVSSTPGVHPPSSYSGFRNLHRQLKEHVTSPHSHRWPIVVQCSSIGTLGKDAGVWLQGIFGKALDERANTKVKVKIMYPTLANVRASIEDLIGGNCLPYTSRVHKKQLYLEKIAVQWKSEGRLRTRAVPHIKTYTKLSPDGKKAAWFLLTSANLSKAAWGDPCHGGIRIRSYELGVLFLPKYLTGETEFRVKNHGHFKEREFFPFPYDTPLTPYGPNDKFFLFDLSFTDCS